MNKIGFLGMGKMGSAILRGIIENGLYPKEEIAFFAPSQFPQDKYQNFGIELKENERALVDSSQIIILAVKPQKYDEIFEKLKVSLLMARFSFLLRQGKASRC